MQRGTGAAELVGVLAPRRTSRIGTRSIRRQFAGLKQKGRSRGPFQVSRVRTYAMMRAVLTFRPRPNAAKPSPEKPASSMAQVDASGAEAAEVMLSVWVPVLSP